MPRVKSRLAGLLAIAVLILAGIGYTAWWWQVARLTKTQFAVWVADRNAHGADIGYRDLDVGGFPLSLTVTLTDFHGQDAGGPVWHGSTLIARTRPWAVTHITFRTAGDQQVVWPGQPAIAIARAEGSMDWTFGRGRVAAAQVTLHDLKTSLDPAIPAAAAATAAAAAAPPPLMVTIDQLDLGFALPPQPPQSHSDTGVTVNAAMTSLHLPAETPSVLAPEIQALSVSGRVMGVVPDPVAPSVRHWSEDGGTIELDQARLVWGPLTASLTGTLALDHDLQPQAALTARISGFNETVDALVTSGRIKAKDAGLVKMMLGLLARRPDPNGPPVVEAPVTVQDSNLSVGPLKLGRLPPLRWREP
ncbi:MAG: DUF2125 domain-containing protein [Azospirillaceae bacterium]|nr:DUF2125 domain-containing protein [Azospirillaceae bacterium]